MTTTTTNSKTNGSAAPTARPPPVLWAQRADKLFLTVELEDCLKPTIKLESERLYFRGKSDSIQQDADKNEHEVIIEFYKPIKVENSKHAVRARATEFVIIKEEAAWWPRLLKDSAKQHWLRIDFPKWKDEDDSEDESAAGMGGRPDFSDLMQQFGGAGGMPGMGGMGGMGGIPGMGDMGDYTGAEGDEEFESDDDDTSNPPDLEGDE